MEKIIILAIIAPMIKAIARIVLLAFTAACLVQPFPAHAADKHYGSIKIYTEIKGLEIFVDVEPVGIDIILIEDVEPGQHYVTAIKGDVTIYQKLVDVFPGLVTPVIIQPEKTQQKMPESLTNEQQEYKQQRLKVIALNESDWEITRGGEEISELIFAGIVNDKATIDKYNEAYDEWEAQDRNGAIIMVSGVILALGGLFMQGGAQGLVIAAGITAGVYGYVLMDSAPSPPEHFMGRQDAADKADGYNLALKRKLGLPENYEPD